MFGAMSGFGKRSKLEPEDYYMSEEGISFLPKNTIKNAVIAAKAVANTVHMATIKKQVSF